MLDNFIGEEMNKQELIDSIRRYLGEPMVRVELDDSQIIDSIDFARKKWEKWAGGAATQETFITLALSGGQNVYDLPTGVIDVISYSIDTGLGKVNQLFTVENYLYNQGYYQGLIQSTGGGGFTMISYHIAKDFLETVSRYIVDAYNYTYHKYTNQLEIMPSPPVGNTFYIPSHYDNNGTFVSEQTIDSPGWILLQTMMIEGATLTGYDHEKFEQGVFSEPWIFDYSLALSMKKLGFIRRKFGNFTAMGNQGISLDGDSLVSDAENMLEKLEETLRKEESAIGYGITTGMM